MRRLLLARQLLWTAVSIVLAEERKANSLAGYRRHGGIGLAAAKQFVNEGAIRENIKAALQEMGQLTF
jgi:hypothetical protein